MSHQYPVPEVMLAFGDGEYLFRLNLPQIAELERKCSAGIGTIYARIRNGEWYGVDLVETVRLGLVGGNKGMVNSADVTVSAPRAQQLLETYMLPRPLAEWWQHAQAIIETCVVGYTPESAPAPAKKKAAKPRRRTSTTR